DEIKLNSYTTLLAGLRYDWQAKVKDSNNLGPRLALAISPRRKTVFRAGAGVFYDRLPDSATEQGLLLNGRNTRELIVSQPSFPTPSLAGALPSTWLLSPALRSPYLVQASAAVERPLGNSLRATVEYQYLRGVHLYRARDINAPSVTGLRP